MVGLVRMATTVVDTTCGDCVAMMMCQPAHEYAPFAFFLRYYSVPKRLRFLDVSVAGMTNKTRTRYGISQITDVVTGNCSEIKA